LLYNVEGPVRDGLSALNYTRMGLDCVVADITSDAMPLLELLHVELAHLLATKVRKGGCTMHRVAFGQLLAGDNTPRHGILRRSVGEFANVRL
jgi:hypothetical protein